MKDIKELQQLLMKDVNGDYMMNSTAIGYMIMAAKDAGVDDEIIREIQHNMTFFMEGKSYHEAENAYHNFR